MFLFISQHNSESCNPHDMSLHNIENYFEKGWNVILWWKIVFLLLHLWESCSTHCSCSVSVKTFYTDLYILCIVYSSPVNTAPSKSPLPEANCCENLLKQLEPSILIIHNMLHVEEPPSWLQHSLDLLQALLLVIDRAENKGHHHCIHGVVFNRQLLPIPNLHVLDVQTGILGLIGFKSFLKTLIWLNNLNKKQKMNMDLREHTSMAPSRGASH